MIFSVQLKKDLILLIGKLNFKIARVIITFDYLCCILFSSSYTKLKNVLLHTKWPLAMRLKTIFSYELALQFPTRQCKFSCNFYGTHILNYKKMIFLSFKRIERAVICNNKIQFVEKYMGSLNQSKQMCLIYLLMFNLGCKLPS